MLFKLSLKNIKKSIKDYSIYFFTLVVAVAIFYIFNSLDAQSSMLIMTESKHDVVKSLIYILNYVSVFISVILGFLIIYSNNFLIKRRKKEFGLYLTLGMSKRKVSLILVMETMLVGIISLGVGLLIGVFLSQFLSILTIKLFEANMEGFKFVFSSASLVKTLIYFGVIFVLVMIFNIFSLSKNKLIDLLNASKKNEKVRYRNTVLVIIAFLGSIGLLWYAYYLLFNGVLFSLDNRLIYMLVAGALGTYLLFFSVSGFFLRILAKSKKLYYKNLNMFILKQVNNKANTTVVSTTIICLMLLLTIGILSGSMSLISIYNSGLSDSNKTDFTIEAYESNCTVNAEGNCEFKKIDSTILKELTNKSYFNDYVKKYSYYELYLEDDITTESLIDDETMKDLRKRYGEAIDLTGNIDIMSESDLNNILELYGSKDKFDIKPNEYLLTASLDTAIDFYDYNYENGNRLKINNKLLKPASKEIYNISIKNYSSASNFGTIIVDDSVIDGLELGRANIIGDYVSHSISTNDFENEFFRKVSFEGYSFSYTTKLAMRETGVNLKVILVFVGLYLGITFAISSATVLAIGQLSESSDNKMRYKVLGQIGADDKMIKHALFAQIAIAFILPLIVALFHAYFGLRELNGTIKIIGDIDITSNIILTTLFIIVVYGGYFLATYLCSKSIIKE